MNHLQEQAQPEQQGVTRRSFAGLAAAGIAGAIAVVAAGDKNPIGRIFGKKPSAGSKSGGGSMFTPRDPQP
ncbi:MAG: hypothetical protein QF554_06420 [Dehalococcoidia bacterium]|nr:hypothetical protein [Dehalococcoidia bacterium]